MTKENLITKQENSERGKKVITDGLDLGMHLFHVVVECPLNIILCKAKQSRRMLGKFLRPYYLQILKLAIIFEPP